MLAALVLVDAATGVFTALPAWAQETATTETFQLVVGQQKVLTAPGVSRIAIGDPNVADVKVVAQNQVLVTAVGPGRTEITVWKGNKVSTYEVTVTRLDARELKREVEKLLGDREGITVKLVKDRVVLDGSALSLADMDRAEEITRIYPQVQNLVKMDPAAHNLLAEAANNKLQKAGLGNARATVVGATVFLEGIVDSPADLKKAEVIAASVGPRVESVLRVGSSKMVELDVEFVEIAKSSLDRIGVRWPTDLSGNLNLSYSSSTVMRGAGGNQESVFAGAGVGASLGLALQFNDGITRTLARPRLVTASSQEASFLAGGELPIPIVLQDRVYVEYKEYGIRLKITPVADAGGTIQTKVMTEISERDDSVSVMGIPGFVTRRVDTSVTVKDGETIVLSGLLQLSEGKDITKIPFLGHIPIVGELFKSRQFRERQTELVVFVTPRIVDPVAKSLKELGADILDSYREAEGDVGFSLFD